jgi:hypothetical protein
MALVLGIPGPLADILFAAIASDHTSRTISALNEHRPARRSW